ncbi:MAG: hypothetical protein HY925_05135 [Elusimicrobia bacterium]|nr:hypothetical protein [Elusimicrobiota bacterium]
MKLLLLAAVAALAYQYYPRPLDGSVWDVKVKRDVLLSWSHKETLVFAGGKVAAGGVVPARYSTSGSGDGLQWTATLPGERGETLGWQGAVTGDAIEGTVLSTDAKGRVRRYRFSGHRKGVPR